MTSDSFDHQRDGSGTSDKDLQTQSPLLDNNSDQALLCPTSRFPISLLSKDSESDSSSTSNSDTTSSALCESVDNRIVDPQVGLGAAGHNPPSEPKQVTHPSHCTPCSQENYLDLTDSFHIRIELVNGLLWCPQEMPNRSHNLIQNYLKYLCILQHEKGKRQLDIYTEVEVLIPSVNEVCKNRRLSISSTSSASPLSKSETAQKRRFKKATYRMPDLTVANYLSDDEIARLSPKSQNRGISRQNQVLLAVEVVSDSTRQADLYEKWAEYARAGIEEYLIIDPVEQAVIRGSLERKSISDVYIAHGDPNKGSVKLRERSAGTDSSHSIRRYYRKIFKGNDIIDVSVLQGLSVDQIMAKTLLKPPRETDERSRAVAAYEQETAGYRKEIERLETEAISVKKKYKDLEDRKNKEVKDLEEKYKDLEDRKNMEVKDLEDRKNKEVKDLEDRKNKEVEIEKGKVKRMEREMERMKKFFADQSGEPDTEGANRASPSRSPLLKKRRGSRTAGRQE